MSQKGSKVGIKDRINTLKGWARSLGTEVPLTPKPTVVKQRKNFKKKQHV